jgi:inorganic pyrophosphatase
MPLDISVSRQYGDNTVTLRTNLPVTKSGPSPPMRTDLGSAGASDLPAGGLGGVGRLVSTASFFGDAEQGGARQRRASYLSEEQGVSGDEARARPAVLRRGLTHRRTEPSPTAAPPPCRSSASRPRSTGSSARPSRVAST